MNEKLCILIRISLKCVHKGPIDNKSSLVQVMAWSDKATSYSMNQCWPSSLTHICTGGDELNESAELVVTAVSPATATVIILTATSIINRKHPVWSDTIIAVQSVENWIVYAWVFHPSPEKQLRQGIVWPTNSYVLLLEKYAPISCQVCRVMLFFQPFHTLLE